MLLHYRNIYYTNLCFTSKKTICFSSLLSDRCFISFKKRFNWKKNNFDIEEICFSYSEKQFMIFWLIFLQILQSHQVFLFRYQAMSMWKHWNSWNVYFVYYCELTQSVSSNYANTMTLHQLGTTPRKSYSFYSEKSAIITCIKTWKRFFFFGVAIQWLYKDINFHISPIPRGQFL